MQISTKQLSSTKIQISVTADEKLATRIKDSLVKEMGKNIQVTGFRKGHAPAHLAEKSIDQGQLQSRFLDAALSEMYAEAIIKEGLRPVGQPAVSVTKFVPFNTLEAEIEVDVVGEIKLPDYKKFKITPTKVTVKNDEIDAVIDDLLNRDAKKKPVKRAAKEGDEIVIEFKGTDAKTDEAIPGADGKEYPIVIGSNTFIPGFEPELIGLKAGATKTFQVTFPKDYGAKQLQNKKVKFEVTAGEVREITLPKLDAKFAEKVGPFKTVDELKADIKKQLQLEKENQARRKTENDILTELAEKTKVDLPHQIIDEELERMIQEEMQSAMYRGQTWQEYLEAAGTDEEAHRKEVRTQAKMRVVSGVALGSVAQKEGITVSEEEQAAQITALKERYSSDKMMQEELSKPENQRDIANRILSEKTVAKLYDYIVK